MTPENARRLLNAYLDGELDAASIIELEAQMRESPALQQEFECLSALQNLVQSRGSRFDAPPHLASRVFAALPEARPVGTSKTVPSWWRPLAIGTTMAAVALLFWSIISHIQPFWPQRGPARGGIGGSRAFLDGGSSDGSHICGKTYRQTLAFLSTRFRTSGGRFCWRRFCPSGWTP